jgi:hypothetical protein
LQLRLQFGIGQRLAARGQRGLDGLLGQVDGGATGLFSSTARAAMPFISSVIRPGLAQELGLGVFQIGGRGAWAKAAWALSTMAFNSFIYSGVEKKKGLAPFKL